MALSQVRRLISICVLTVTWCGLWGSISVANVAGGAVLAAGITSRTTATSSVRGIRAVPLVRLVGLVVADLVRSTVNVAAEILTPADRTDESIIAVQIPQQAREHLLFLVIAITLTPGTAVVETDHQRSVLYLHLLHDQRREATISHVEQLAHLVCEALPRSSTGVFT